MMRRWPAILLLLPLLVVLPLASAAATSVTAAVDRTNVSLGQQIELTITIETDQSPIGEPKFEDMSAFDIYSSGTTRNFQWINGKTSGSLVYSYTLSPRDEGEFVIGPATVTIANMIYKTSPIKITVAPSRTRVQSQNQAPPTTSGQTPKPKGDRRVFITAELDRDTAYVNQPVTYVFRFFQGERLLANPEYTRPSFPGFWVEDLPPQKKYSKVVDGIRYEVTEIRYALFPTDAGPKPIDGTRLKARVSSGKKPSRRDPFSMFGGDIFGRFEEGEDLTLKTDPLTLTVLPFPLDGKPDNFAGLVGNFSLNLTADVRTVAVGDPLTVTLTVRGDGNIKSAQMPWFDTLSDFRTFPAGSSESVSTEGYRISGTKTFEQVFVPQRPGAYLLPAFTMSCFDPHARRYKELSTGQLEITATGAAKDFTIPQLTLNRDELADLASDVRLIRTEGADLRHRRDPGLFGWAFWMGHTLPLLGLAVFFGWRRHTMKVAADPVGRRRRRACRNAIAALSESGRGRDHTPLSIESVAEALLNYYGDRFNRSAHGVIRQDLREDLLRDGAAPDDVVEYLRLLDECDRGRYARTGTSVTADIAARARTILERLEGSVK